MFVVPGVVSVLLFLLLWRGNSLRRPAVVGGWVVGGLALQWAAPTYSPLWVAGLVVNVGVAIYLVIKFKTAW